MENKRKPNHTHTLVQEDANQLNGCVLYTSLSKTYLHNFSFFFFTTKTTKWNEHQKKKANEWKKIVLKPLFCVNTVKKTVFHVRQRPKKNSCCTEKRRRNQILRKNLGEEFFCKEEIQKFMFEKNEKDFFFFSSHNLHIRSVLWHCNAPYIFHI